MGLKPWQTITTIYPTAGIALICIPRASKHLVKRYLDPKNMPKSASQEVFGGFGMSRDW